MRVVFVVLMCWFCLVDVCSVGELVCLRTISGIVSEFGLSLKEDLPPNMPEPRGQGFVIRAYVDADHASDSVTRQSRSGFIVYLNMAPVYWTSKKQTGVETSSFGSEFIAMKQCTE